MNPNEIAARLSIKSPPFTGLYEKRKMKSKHLFCWFNTEGDVIFPHVSLHLSPEHTVWSAFHITFPIMKMGGFSETIETVSYSMRYRIVGGTATADGITSTQGLHRVNRHGQNFDKILDGGMSLGEMRRESVEFAKAFVVAARNTVGATKAIPRPE